MWKSLLPLSPFLYVLNYYDTWYRMILIWCFFAVCTPPLLPHHFSFFLLPPIANAYLASAVLFQSVLAWSKSSLSKLHVRLRYLIHYVSWLTLCLFKSNKERSQLYETSCHWIHYLYSRLSLCVLRWRFTIRMVDLPKPLYWSLVFNRIGILILTMGIDYTMKRNLPKLSNVLIFWINLLNFSLKNISQTVKKLIFVYFY